MVKRAINESHHCMQRMQNGATGNISKQSCHGVCGEGKDACLQEAPFAACVRGVGCAVGGDWKVVIAWVFLASMQVAALATTQHRALACGRCGMNMPASQSLWVWVYPRRASVCRLQCVWGAGYVGRSHVVHPAQVPVPTACWHHMPAQPGCHKADCRKKGGNMVCRCLWSCCFCDSSIGYCHKRLGWLHASTSSCQHGAWHSERFLKVLRHHESAVLTCSDLF
jgi:hypothetical protein